MLNLLCTDLKYNTVSTNIKFITKELVDYMVDIHRENRDAGPWSDWAWLGMAAGEWSRMINPFQQHLFLCGVQQLAVGCCFSALMAVMKPVFQHHSLNLKMGMQHKMVHAEKNASQTPWALAAAASLVSSIIKTAKDLLHVLFITWILREMRGSSSTCHQYNDASRRAGGWGT